MDINIKNVEDSNKLVGIEFKNNKDNKKNEPYVYFPIGYNIKNGIIDCKDREKIKEIFDLIKIIHKYPDGSVEINTNQAETNKFPYSAYMEIIRYFVDNGYYKPREVEYKIDTKGKINWKRTIQKIRPFVQDNAPLYTNFVIRKNIINENDIITEIHKYCVAFSLSRIGFLYNIDFNLNNYHSKMENNKSFLDRAKILLQTKLSHTNNDKLKRLFTAMYNVLDNQDYMSNSFQNFSYGTKHFEHVWENLINDIFGIPYDDRKEYNPKAHYDNEQDLNDDTGEYETDKEKKLASLRIDTIMINETEEKEQENKTCDIYILDAKYYKIKKLPVINLPAIADINKQITYGDSVYYKIEANGDKFKFITNDKSYNVHKHHIGNAFILPNNLSNEPNETNEIKYEKTANVKWRPFKEEKDKNKRHLKVHAIYFDTKTLLQLANAPETEKLEYKKKLIDVIDNAYKQYE